MAHVGLACLAAQWQCHILASLSLRMPGPSSPSPTTFSLTAFLSISYLKFPNPIGPPMTLHLSVQETLISFSLNPHVPLVFNFLIIFPSLFSLNGVTCWTFFSFYNHAIVVPLAAASLQLFYFSKHFELRQTKDQVSHIHIKPRKTFIVLCI